MQKMEVQKGEITWKRKREKGTEKRNSISKVVEEKIGKMK